MAKAKDTKGKGTTVKKKAVKKTTTPKKEAAAKKEEKKEEVFVPLCGEGMEFNPAKKSTCNMECKADNPEAFKACQEHFKNRKVTTAKKRTPKRGKTDQGRLVDSQIGKIEAVLASGELLTEKELAEKAETTVKRLRRFFRQVTYREDRPVFLDADGKVFMKEHHPKKKEAKQAYVIRDIQKSKYIKKWRPDLLKDAKAA